MLVEVVLLLLLVFAVLNGDRQILQQGLELVIPAAIACGLTYLVAWTGAAAGWVRQAFASRGGPA